MISVTILLEQWEALLACAQAYLEIVSQLTAAAGDIDAGETLH